MLSLFKRKPKVEQVNQSNISEPVYKILKALEERFHTFGFKYYYRVSGYVDHYNEITKITVVDRVTKLVGVYSRECALSGNRETHRLYLEHNGVKVHLTEDERMALYRTAKEALGSKKQSLKFNQMMRDERIRDKITNLY